MMRLFFTVPKRCCIKNFNGKISLSQIEVFLVIYDILPQTFLKGKFYAYRIQPAAGGKCFGIIVGLENQAQ